METVPARRGGGECLRKSSEYSLQQKYDIRKMAINQSLVDFFNYHIFQK